MNKLKLIRESMGLTQKEMADIINVSKGTYCKKENGQIRFSLGEAFLIANHFGETIESIFETEVLSKL